MCLVMTLYCLMLGCVVLGVFDLLASVVCTMVGG